MNTMYNHDERMNALKMQEINREIEHLYLLKEAGLSEPGILSRTARALGNWLKAQVQRVRERRATRLSPYQTADDRTGC